ncbi:DUF2130 domain-containing protein [Candidatus Amesbacteria bacterium]|nr:DUF2130 domain-containing protein [Candidatus Amesbacteria bacterium]
MNNQIKCPYCNKSFEPTDAYKHELEEKLHREVQGKHQEEIAKLKHEKQELAVAKDKELENAKKQVAEAVRLEVEKKIKQELQKEMEATQKQADTQAKQNTKLQEQLEEQSKIVGEMKSEKDKLRVAHEQELEETRKKTTETVRKEAEDKIRQELETKITSVQDEAQAREKQNTELQEQVRETLKQMRELKDEKDSLSIEYEKKLLEGQDKIKQTAKREAQEELGLRIAEKDKKLQDAEKQILELQRKIQQGSQQLQGEVQELKLEELLGAEFPFDEIKEVPKGIGGADVLQVVRTQTGMACGTIIWESKRTKNWSPGWIQKLIEDQRAVKADVAVLVSNVLPQGVTAFGMIESVFVVDLQSAMSLAFLLRQQLMKVYAAHVANNNKATKAEVVYNYLISNEFKQRIDAWVEYFRDRQEKINKERMYFNKKWQEEEKSIHKVIETTAGIYGDLQGLTGNALPRVSNFELLESTEQLEDKSNNGA